MKRFLIALAVICASIGLLFSLDSAVEDAKATQSSAQQSTLAVRLDINIVEMAEKDIKDYGIEQSILYDLIVKRFASANIIVKTNPDLPKFVLQIKSLPADHSIATIIQGSFYEEATIVQNKKTIWAITWSQTGIITGPKDQYKKFIQDETTNIVNSFVLDYQQNTLS